MLLQQSCPPLISASYCIPIRRATLPFSSFQRLLLCVLKHSTSSVPQLPSFITFVVLLFFLIRFYTVYFSDVLNCFFHSKRHWCFFLPRSQSPFFALLSQVIWSTACHYLLILLLFWRKESTKKTSQSCYPIFHMGSAHSLSTCFYVIRVHNSFDFVCVQKILFQFQMIRKLYFSPQIRGWRQ